MVAAVLAHSGQFTWDEALMVLVPIALVAGVLVLANQRAKKIQAERATAGDLADGTGDGDGTERPDDPLG